MRNEDRANELEDRLIDFAVRIINVADALPKTPPAGISRGRFFVAALRRRRTTRKRGAESRSDFVHKLKIALKELNETSVWLRMVCRSSLLKAKRLDRLMEENLELCRILNASVSTASVNGKRSSARQS